MTRVMGYLRPDMNRQNMPSQLEQLKVAGATQIFQEQPSTAKSDRPQLDKLLAEVTNGDTVVVASLDRIAHNTKHLLEIVEALNAAGATFKVVDSGIDTSAADGKVVGMLLRAVIAFERQLVQERQSVGIARAKQEGRYKGRKPTARAKTDEVLALSTQGLTRQKIADQLGIGVASVYRILKTQAISRKKQKKPAKPVDKPKRVERKPTREPVVEQLSFF